MYFCEDSVRVLSDVRSVDRRGTEYFRSRCGKRVLRITSRTQILEARLLQVYAAVGMAAHEPLPAFSNAEYKELEAFSRTAAGNKLIAQKVMESLGARRTVMQQIQQVVSSCAR
jgi:hypothetical protein